jgi:ABC-type uncharacterized transport system permease subunit
MVGLIRYPPSRPLAPEPSVRRVEPSNHGDVIFGVVLRAFAGRPKLLRVRTFASGVFGSTIVLASFLILVLSLSFYAGRTDGAEFGFNSILLVSANPIDIFSGAIKTAFFTLVPAAFIASDPPASSTTSTQPSPRNSSSPQSSSPPSPP